MVDDASETMMKDNPIQNRFILYVCKLCDFIHRALYHMITCIDGWMDRGCNKLLFSVLIKVPVIFLYRKMSENSEKRLSQFIKVQGNVSLRQPQPQIHSFIYSY